MADTRTLLREDYAAALMAYLSEKNELRLVRAGALGRQAIAEGLGLLDVVVIHQESLAAMLRSGGIEDPEQAVEASTTFLCETLSPFEMALRGFKETSASITHVMQFAAAVSHELRTPLTSLINSMGMLAEVLHSAPGSNEGRLLANIQTSIDILRARADDLLDLVGFQTGALSIHPRRVDVPALLAGAVERAAAGSSDVQLRLTVSGEIPPLLADPDRLQQVVSNLLDNALKYGAEGGRIDVRASVKGKTLCIEVQDYGPGVSLWERLKIWQPNYRGQGRSIDIPGLGIGLALCKELVQQHHGFITLDSGVDKGSLFRVELPLRPPRGKAGDRR